MHAQGTRPSGLGIAFSPDNRVLAIGQSDGVVRLADVLTGADWARFSHPELNRASVMAFSPDQTRLVTMPLEAELPQLVWDLTSIRRELAHRGLDWPQEVLQAQAAVEPAVRTAPIAVTLDDGNLLDSQEAAELLRQAGAASGATARDLLQRAVELDPTSAACHNEIAWLLTVSPSEIRDPEKSLQHARRAIELEPGKALYINTLGTALCRAGRYDEAIPVLQRSLELSREQSGAYDLLFLALAYAGKGDADTARDYYAQATAWFEAHRQRLSANWREELPRLLDEVHAAIIR